METLKLSFFAAHGKTSYLIFLGADFRAPKSGHRCENRSVLGPGFEYIGHLNLLYIHSYAGFLLKCSISDIWHGSKYALILRLHKIFNNKIFHDRCYIVLNTPWVLNMTGF